MADEEGEDGSEGAPEAQEEEGDADEAAPEARAAAPPRKGEVVEEDPPTTTSRRTFVKVGVAVAGGAWAAAFGGSVLRSITSATQTSTTVAANVFTYHVPTGESPWYAAKDGQPVLVDEFPIMQSAKVFVNGVKGILMRLDEGKLVDRTGSELGFVAFNSTCTHLGCQVYFLVGKTPIGQFPDGLVYCPCHQGAFDPYRGAKVVYGPPPQPLPRIPLRVVNGRLEAT